MIERLGPAAQRHGLEKHANTKMIIELVGVVFIASNEAAVLGRELQTGDFAHPTYC